MASRARNPDGHFKFFAQTFAVIVQELCVTVWIDEREHRKDVQQTAAKSADAPLFLLSCTSILIVGYGKDPCSAPLKI